MRNAFRGFVTSACERRSLARRRRADWVVAIAGPVIITAVLLPFGSFFALSSVLLFVLLAVIAAALIGGLRPALTAVAVGVLAGVFLHVRHYGGLRDPLGVDLAKILAFVFVGVAIAILVGELTRLAAEQGALRRVATLVARAAPPDEVFASVTAEIGLLIPADTTQIYRFERDRTASNIARWSKPGTDLPAAARWKLGGHNVTTLVARTGRPARIDNRADGTGEIGTEARAAGARTSVGAPIVVEGELWGVAVATSTGGRRFRGDTEARLAAFTALVALAIANAESRDELAASRARVLAAADEARRRIERDLHDGTQQRLTALALELRATEAAVPPDMTGIRTQLSRTAKGLAAAVDDLQEISRGIPPAILSKGGLGPAIKALARRSAIPVELELSSDTRLPERIEVGAYYVVSEALTNAVKHSGASVVYIRVDVDDLVAQISIRDDGVGGADPTRGSGLTGLQDRVESLGGTFEIANSVGHGTAILARIAMESGDNGRR
ncbi:MAG: histidine kinase [Actinomycetia bacterium]|nr:histidine kinase [Actinomycetes bacterium]